MPPVFALFTLTRHKKRPRVHHRREVGRGIARGQCSEDIGVTVDGQETYVLAIRKALSNERLDAYGMG